MLQEPRYENHWYALMFSFSIAVSWESEDLWTYELEIGTRDDLDQTNL